MSRAGNRTLDRAYTKALEKEYAREEILRAHLGLKPIKHFVITRFPVASSVRQVIAFGDIHNLRVLAHVVRAR